jgi:hypothetical protein
MFRRKANKVVSLRPKALKSCDVREVVARVCFVALVVLLVLILLSLPAQLHASFKLLSTRDTPRGLGEDEPATTSADISTAISEGMKGAVGAAAAASAATTVAVGVEAPTAAISTTISEGMKRTVGAVAAASAAAAVTVKAEAPFGAQGQQLLTRDHGGRRACTLVFHICYTILQFVFCTIFTMLLLALISLCPHTLLTLF